MQNLKKRYSEKVMRIHHIGIIVSDLNKSVSIYTRLGFVLFDCIKEDVIQNNRVAIMKAKFSPFVELIEPVGKSSSVFNFKDGYHHICYEVDLDDDITKEFKKMKIGKIFTPPIIAPALNNRKVVFACLRSGEFVEFILPESTLACVIRGDDN